MRHVNEAKVAAIIESSMNLFRAAQAATQWHGSTSDWEIEVDWDLVEELDKIMDPVELGYPTVVLPKGLAKRS